VNKAAEGRLAGVRLEVRGNCEAHRSLVNENTRKEVVAELRALPGDFTDNLWIEKIKFETRPAIDREELCLGQDLIGDLLRSIDDLVDHPQQLSELSAVLKPLASKVGGELALDEIDFASHDQLARWVREAEAHLLSHLTEERL
jgi:hypothetical protein